MLQAISGMFRSLILQPMKEFVASWGAALLAPVSSRMRNLLPMPTFSFGGGVTQEQAAREFMASGGWGAGVGADSGVSGIGAPLTRPSSMTTEHSPSVPTRSHQT